MSAVRWPAPIRNFVQLKAAMKAGFSLVQKPESINFALHSAGEYSHTSVLSQGVAAAACQKGVVEYTRENLPDGGRVYRLRPESP